jgi:hypothetical protein
MPAVSFLRSWCLPLCLAACLSCAHSNIKVDDDKHPVFNTGVGATILYPGQSPAMPPAHPGHQLPGGAPIPAQPGAREPHGQPLPAPSGTIGGAPTSTVHRGPGSTASSSGGGGITFIGGSEVDEDTYTEMRAEPWWRKYLLAPFAIAAYPFVAVWNAATGDDGPPPTRTAAAPTAPSLPPPAPVDVQTGYERSQLEALERELAGQSGGQPTASRPPPAPRIERLPPSGDSISAELAALQRGIPPRIPGAPGTVQQARSARSEAQPSGVHQQARSARSEAGAGATQPRRGIADQVTDRNGDGRPDHWVYHHAGQPVRELFDEDADGAPDRHVYYQAETGEKSREEEDTNLDGRIDSWLEYQNAKIARHRRDTDGDGFLDTWSFYRGGKLARQERDLNADGFRDRVGFYQDGRLVREEEDRDGDGRPDRVTLFDEQERILQRDEDRNGDGIVDLRSFYSEGRLIRRELVDEESEERIEEEDLASAAWQSGEEVE